MYALALKNTDAQLRWMPDGTAFVKTGDIPAEWLRDSSAQVRPWLFDAPHDAAARKKLRAVIQRQAICMKVDPYANAFREDYSIWERKFEIDSLAYPMLLAWTYWKQTGDARVFTREVHDGFAKALATLRLEQDHDGSQPGRPRSTYTFKSDTEEAGKNPVSYTGMIWCGFRPSDDVCTYNYLIPSQMQVVQALTALEEIYREVYRDAPLANEAKALRDEVHTGVEKYGTVDDPTFGRRYVYETDGRGNSLSMDDANLPSLMSAPYFGYVPIDDPIYRNTRRFALSKANPFYFDGRLARGIGSPHVPKPWVWPLDLLAEGLTTRSASERRTLVDYLLASDPGDSRLHESFDSNDPKQFTRPDFGWPNALFVELVKLARGQRPLPTPPAHAAIADTARLAAARPLEIAAAHEVRTAAAGRLKTAATPQSVVLHSGDTELRLTPSGVIEGIGPAKGPASPGDGAAVFNIQDRRSGLKRTIRYEAIGETGVFKRSGTIELPRAGNYVIPTLLEPHAPWRQPMVSPTCGAALAKNGKSRPRRCVMVKGVSSAIAGGRRATTNPSCCCTTRSAVSTSPLSSNGAATGR